MSWSDDGGVKEEFKYIYNKHLEPEGRPSLGVVIVTDHQHIALHFSTYG